METTTPSTTYIKDNLIGTTDPKPIGKSLYSVEATVKGISSKIPLLLYSRHKSRAGKDPRILQLIHTYNLVGRWERCEEDIEDFYFEATPRKYTQ